jgi:hypothetical protein
MKGCQVTALLLMASMIAASLFLGIFACAHFADNYWSLFIYPWSSLGLYFVPQICYGYWEPEEVAFHGDGMGTHERSRKQNLGYAMGAIIAVTSYLVPVIAWWHGFDWLGAVLVIIALTFWVWKYLIWLRVFIIIPHDHV